jgi:hypothetical protein
MPRIRSLLNPLAYFRFAAGLIRKHSIGEDPNLRGVTYYPPGHFCSPLLDIRGLGSDDLALPFDGPEDWEHVDLRPEDQKRFFQELVDKYPLLPFPEQKSNGYRYYSDNRYFVLSDAFSLSGVMRSCNPKRIVEVGSGFSSAVMLDTLELTGASTEMTFIEPHPSRLLALLSAQDKLSVTILENRVQEVPLTVFDQLDVNDVLFVDSSHVAKVGSDVSYLFLRVLPRLRPGVIVHVHDVCYPYSMPPEWIRQGRAWNESLFLRAFLIGNSNFHVMAFNQFAAQAFPDVFKVRVPSFLSSPGGSIWIRKVA